MGAGGFSDRCHTEEYRQKEWLDDEDIGLGTLGTKVGTTKGVTMSICRKKEAIRKDARWCSEGGRFSCDLAVVPR